MFKRIPGYLLLTTILCTVFISPIYAQKVDKEIKNFTQSFQKAYNKKDHASLTSMFTADAVRVNPDGATITGAQQIGETYAQTFSATDQTVDIKLGTVTPQSDTKALVTGTYTVKGKNKSTGEAIDLVGAYENIAVKENGKWKIANMKLTSKP